MRRITLFSTVFIVASIATAAPVVQSVQNAASNVVYRSLGVGGIFVIKGTGLGPPNISIDSKPFQNTSLSGTSIAVTAADGTNVKALMYYTSDAQVAALLPSNTPPGRGTFTVTYNGQTSAPMNHNIEVNSVGIFSIDSSGGGPAIVTYPDYSLVSPVKAANCGGPNTTCGAANPGDVLIIWATGLGPVSGGSDSSGAGLGKNMPNVPLTLYLGGVQAPVSYQGRSGCCIGEDQIVFTVPNNVPTGCAVPLVAQIGTGQNTISNTTVIPVANGSRTCTPTNPALASSGTANIQQAVMAGPINVGILELHKNLNNGTGPGYFDQTKFTFIKSLNYASGTQPFFLSFVDDQPLGTCLVYSNPNGNASNPISNAAPLDAGTSFTVKGPNGSVPLAGNPGQFKAMLSAAGTFLVPGSYTVTSNGGPDVGPINATLTIPSSPTLLTPQPSNNLTVTRANGMTFTWNPNGSNGHVEIQVASATDGTFNFGGAAVCTAPASAGSFTIPAYVMLALTSSNFTFLEFGLGTQAAAAEALYTAKGLDFGMVQAYLDGVFFGGFALQ
jgi:uncharacterized protein (TIGR03437 family)